MLLQLYLNYKLKSVAHLPWRQMTYKFLNTIIDDLFAFVIKMPTLHRLSVFRCTAAAWVALLSTEGCCWCSCHQTCLAGECGAMLRCLYTLWVRHWCAATTIT